MGKLKIKLLVDNKYAIDLTNHSTSHGISNHIERKYHFLNDQVNKDKLEIDYCKIKLQLADILTKPLKKEMFDYLKKLMGMRNLADMLYEECHGCNLGLIGV